MLRQRSGGRAAGPRRSGRADLLVARDTWIPRLPAPPWWEGQPTPGVLTPEQVFEGKRPPGQRIVAYDTDGYYFAPGIAELLAAEGFEVTVVTTFAVPSPAATRPWKVTCSMPTFTRRAPRSSTPQPSPGRSGR